MSFICHIHNYTEYNQQWNVFSAFNPSKCTHTWSSGQPSLRRPGSSRGLGTLLKGLTLVVDNSCRSRDSNPRPQITSTTLYPLGHDCPVMKNSLLGIELQSPAQEATALPLRYTDGSDKRSETIPSSRISPDHFDSQLHDGASSLQFTSLIFYRFQVNGHSRSLVLCLVTHFCIAFEFVFGLLSSWKIQTRPIIRLITVSHF